MRSALRFLIGIAFVVVMLIYVPATRIFLLISLPLGLIVAAILYVWHRSRPVREPQELNSKRPLGLD